jgi:hypothetical protein
MTTTAKIDDLIDTAPEQPKAKVPIVFHKNINTENFNKRPSTLKPKDWDNVVYLLRTVDGYDLMLAFDNNRGPRGLFIGQWNDGVVE